MTDTTSTSPRCGRGLGSRLSVTSMSVRLIAPSPSVTMSQFRVRQANPTRLQALPSAAGAFFCEIASHQVAIVRDVVREQRTQSLDVVAPVAVQLAGDGEPVYQLHPGR